MEKPEVPDEVRAYGRRNALIGWAKCTDRRERTRPGKEAAEQRFRDMAVAAGHTTPEAIEQAAQAFRRAHYANMVIRSVASRKAKAARRRVGE